MQGKIISLSDHLNKYVKKADECAVKENYTRALGYLFSALSIKRTPEILSAIANTYADMGLYALSNQCWFYYLEKMPEKKCGRAYEELAINHFYLNNFAIAGYYFNKKLEVDGFLSQEGIDKEILDYYSAPQEEKKFRLVYPPERADFSDEIKKAKQKMTAGDFDGAIKIYQEIPDGVKDHDKIADDYSLACFLAGDVEKAVEINRKRLKEGGDKFTIYCNLSSMYGALKNKEKSQYYYSLALSEPPKSTEDEYRLATASLEQHNEEKGLALLEKVAKERQYDIDTDYLLSLVKINTGRYEEAEKLLKKLLKINPYDFLWKYYYKLVKKLIKGDEQAKALLPISYELDIPVKEREEWVNKVKHTALASLGTGKRPERFNEIMEWGVRNYSGNETFAKACVLSYGGLKNKAEEKFLREKLMDADISADLKVVMLYLLVMQGVSDKISLVVSGVFVRTKPKKLKFGEDISALGFSSAYALCFSKSVVMGITDVGTIAKSAERLHEKFKRTSVYAGEGEIATLIMEGCKFPYFKNLREICEIFGTDEISVSKIKRELKGEQK